MTDFWIVFDGSFSSVCLACCIILECLVVSICDAICLQLKIIFAPDPAVFSPTYFPNYQFFVYSKQIMKLWQNSEISCLEKFFVEISQHRYLLFGVYCNTEYGAVCTVHF
jgi:hypothetical protein